MAVEVEVDQKQLPIVLVLGSVVQEVGLRICRHLRWEEEL